MAPAPPAGRPDAGPTAGPEHQVLPAVDRRWQAVLCFPVVAAAATALATATVAAVTQGAAPLLADLRTGGASPGPLAAVLLVASLLVGLPHGAVDLLRPETTDPAAAPRQRRRATLRYLGTAAAAVLAWVLAPLPVLLGLLVLSVLHFGTADDVTARWLGWSRPTPLAVARVLALGGLPVALPLGLHGGAVAELLDALTGGAGDVVRVAARLALPVVLAAAAVVVLDALAQRRPLAALEPVALLALFGVATPLLAFAVYFGLWHSWRQVARIVAVDAYREGTAARSALLALVRAAALPSVSTVAVAAVAAALVGEDADAGPALLTVALVGVLCLTVPHAVVVARTDRHLVVARADQRYRPTGDRPARTGSPGGDTVVGRPPSGGRPARDRRPRDHRCGRQPRGRRH